MKKQELEKRQNTITKTLLAIYLIVLAWIVLMKTGFSFKDLNSIREVNLIPFAQSVIVNNRIYYREIYLNIFVFVPFGIYISMLNFNWFFIKKIVLILSVSLLFETLQYVFAIGSTDITDIITNTSGGIVGILFYFIVSKLFKNKTKINKIFNILALISTSGFILLSVLLLLANN